MYAKNDLNVQSTFYSVAALSEINKGLASQEKPIILVPATDYLNTHIEVVDGIRIAGRASVFVSSKIQTIRLRVTDAIVVRKICGDSIFSEDLGLKPIKDEDEDNASK